MKVQAPIGSGLEATFGAIEPTEIIRLSIEGQRQVAEVILNPPAPNKAWKKAAKRYRELFGETS